MSVKSDLRKLSKNELIAIILDQGERLEKVELILRQYDNPHTPSSQKRFKENSKKDVDENKKRFPGREKGHDGVGIRLPKADRVVEHKLDRPGLVFVKKRVKKVIDFADKPLEVIKHVIYVYRDEEGNLVQDDVDLPSGIYGRNLQAFASLLKGKCGVSHATIADLIKSMRPDLSYCSSTNLALTEVVSNNLTSNHDDIVKQIRQAFFCHADETVLRHDGQNGYAWTFCTPTYVVYEPATTRSKTIPQNILGQDYNNILVVDGYSGYNDYKKQRCWAHLKRELEELAEKHETIKKQYGLFCELYKKCEAMKTKPPDQRKKFIKKANKKIDNILESVMHFPSCKDFVTKLTNAKPHLFTGVKYPEIPLDNNHAERMIRKIVIHRKIIGCIRNQKGQKFIRNTLSAIQTWQLQGKNSYEELKGYAG